MKKKSIFPRLLTALLVVTLFSACLLSGNTTLAMYRAEATGTGNAVVAKWGILVGSQNIAKATPQTLTINLFDTILCETPVTPDTATSQDSHVKAATGTDPKIIAPGTKGSFATVKIKNDSDVYAKIVVTIDLTDAGSLIKTAANTGGVITLTTSGWTETTAGTKYTLTYASVAPGTEVNLEGFAWLWTFLDGSGSAGQWNQNAQKDNPLGIAAYDGTAATLTAKITVDATQVD